MTREEIIKFLESDDPLAVFLDPNEDWSNYQTPQEQVNHLRRVLEKEPNELERLKIQNAILSVAIEYAYVHGLLECDDWKDMFWRSIGVAYHACVREDASN